ncbi:MAG: hypothetical protein RL131_331 [Bacteroidota bacterium]
MKIVVRDISVFLGGIAIVNKVGFTLENNDHLAICGPSGSGKSTIAKVLHGDVFARGELFFLDQNTEPIVPKSVYVDQQHRFKNRSNVSNFYYQQRYNSTDNEDSLTVLEELNRLVIDAHHEWITAFDILKLLDKPLIQLSNGENKRLQLVKALTASPDILILDNPYLGLDATGRLILSESINRISESGIKIILIANEEDLPSCITHVLWMENGNGSFHSKSHFLENNQLPQASKLTHSAALHSLFKKTSSRTNAIIELKNLHIQYGAKLILNNINWKVMRGERWCVTGPNGSGKSTLLSLITADNPQGYANEIYLFGKKRGSGESIWDIKSKIGYVSPELHLYFDQGFTCKEVVASGLFDTIGLFRKLTQDQEILVAKWLDAMEISDLQDKYMHQLSLGMQRWVMLTRAFVKNPELLILDEPCQGLDRIQTQNFLYLIDSICNDTNLTLIYVSHYTEDIPTCITHRMHLENGNVVA